MNDFRNWFCAAVAAIACVTSAEAAVDADYGNIDWSGNYYDGAEDVFFCGNDDEGFEYGGEAFFDYENFRSLPEGRWDGNIGAVIGANVGIPLPFDDCNDWGVQLGASFGIYDWAGRGDVFNPKSNHGGSTQNETFLTLGIYKKVPCSEDFSYGFAFDWQFNNRAGVFALNPGLTQVRFQLAYDMPSDEIGIWGAVHGNSPRKSLQGLPVKFRTVNQINLFWQHDYCNCARTVLWVGLPYGKSLMVRHARPGQYTLGGSFKVPLMDCWAVEGRAMYMGAKRGSVGVASRNAAANVCVGLTYTFGHNRDCCDLQPYLPLANNSNFIVDTSLND